MGKHGAKKWSLIAQHLPGRIGKQCRERWHNHLNPEIRKCDWTPEEDEQLVRLHRQIGNQWAQLAQNIPGEVLLAEGERPFAPNLKTLVRLPGGGIVCLMIVEAPQIGCRSCEPASDKAVEPF